MGEVYEAVETPINRRVALKVILQKDEADLNEEVLRFLNEAKALGRVTHTQVVTLFNVGQHDGYHFIAMEFVEGISLRDLMKQFVLSGKEATSLAAQMLSGLSALHEQNIIHRDLSPRNILVRPNGMIKIIDLGIAKQVDQQDMTATGIIMGTVSYMAPEIIYGLPANVRTDLWAAGAILFEATSGHGLTTSHASLNGQEYPTESQSWVPVNFRKFVAKLCAGKPEERYASAQEALNDLSKMPGANVDEGTLALATLARKIENLVDVQNSLAQAELTGVTAKRALTVAALLAQRKAYPTTGGNKDITEVLKVDTTLRIEAPAVQAALAQIRQGSRPTPAVRYQETYAPPPEPRTVSWATLVLPLLILGAAFFFFKSRKKPAAPVAARPSVAKLVQKITVTSPSVYWLKTGEVPALTWTPALTAPMSLQLSSHADFTSSNTWQAQGDRVDVPPASAGGKYHWRLTSGDAIIGPFEFTVQNIAPLVLKEPTPGHTVSLTKDAVKTALDFAWNCQLGATLYRAQIGRDAEFKNLFTEGQARGCDWKAIELPEGKFYWRARVDAPAQAQMWSEVREISVIGVAHATPTQLLAEEAKPSGRSDLLANLGGGAVEQSERTPAAVEPPAAKPSQVPAHNPKLPVPDGLSPADGATMAFTRGAPTAVQWQTVSGANGYTIEFSADDTFSAPIRRRTDTPSADFRPKWFESKKIFWRVRAEGPSAESDWSQPRFFEIGR